MRRIESVIITHAHIDHIASLPILVSEVFDSARRALPVYALPEVIAVMRRHIFNGEVWPDFQKIPLPDSSDQALEFRELRPGSWIEMGAYRALAVEVNHTVPTAGVFVTNGRVTVGFTSDTYVTDAFWALARNIEGLAALFVDVSYPDEMEELGAIAGHLTPRSLGAEIVKLKRQPEILAVHVKPGGRLRVQQQLEKLDPLVRLVEIGRTYEWPA